MDFFKGLKHEFSDEDNEAPGLGTQRSKQCSFSFCSLPSVTVDLSSRMVTNLNQMACILHCRLLPDLILEGFHLARHIARIGCVLPKVDTVTRFSLYDDIEIWRAENFRDGGSWGQL